MATLSPVRAAVPLLNGLELLSRGKVRDSYELPGALLSSATDGISIFDFVLNARVKMKGIILNALNHFWSEYLWQFEIPTHLAAVGAAIDKYLPADLRGNTDLQSRASVIHRMKMAPVEFIYRSVLTGSSVSSYKKDGTVCEHRLPPGLQDGDSLPCILDTPTTKAEEGHDENMSFREVRERYPQQTMLGLQVFQICSEHCESRGIKLADTKFEFGEGGRIGDEIVTPDSSRFWEFKVWQDGRKLEKRKAPPSYDKQLVRAWGIEQGINKRKPENPDDVAWVHSLEVPEKLIEQTTEIYRYIFWRLTGMTIENYLSDRMDVAVQPKKKKIAFVFGSESDLPTGFYANRERAEIVVHVMSCHRNHFELTGFANSGCGGADVVICAGGKAFALPGVLDAMLYEAGKNVRVIGVALGEPGSKSFEAAKLSIEEIPGAPVVMDEISGQVYAGISGLSSALNRAINGELPPVKARVAKPVRMNIELSAG